MCCNYSQSITRAFRKNMKSKVNRHGYISLWKVFQIVEGRMTGPYQYYSSCHTYKPGLNKSDRLQKDFNFVDDSGSKHINRGIHVCTSLTKAKSIQKNECKRNQHVYLDGNRYLARYIVMKVWAKLSDLVACGDNEDAVFMSVYIPPRNYRRAMKGK